jgi:hypothetical protein
VANTLAYLDGAIITSMKEFNNTAPRRKNQEKFSKFRFLNIFSEIAFLE